MTAAEILSQLQAAGVSIRVDGATLLCRPLSSVPAELAEQVRAHKPELVALLSKPALSEPAPPVCPQCHQQDYLPLGGGWHRCWSCGWRWGPAGTQDPADPADLHRTAALLELGDLARCTVYPRAGEQLASSSPEAAIDEAASDYPAGVLCRRDGCRGLGWDRVAESGGWRCRVCGRGLEATQ